MQNPSQPRPAPKGGNGCLFSGLGCAGVGIVFVVGLVIVGMIRGPKLDTIRADGTTEASLRKSLDAMREDMGPARRKRFDRDLLVILDVERKIAANRVWKEKPELKWSLNLAPADTMQKALDGKTAHQIHAQAENYREVKEGPF